MLRAALLSILSVVLGAVLPGQKNPDVKSGALAKAAPEDPFTKKDPDEMKDLGIVDYGPLPWCDGLRSTDIEKVLGEGRLLWMETEHFRFASNFGTCAQPKDPKARKLLKADLKELNKKCKKIPSSKSKLGPWLRLHIYAHRAEQLYAEFAELSGKTEAGKFLGAKDKFLILLFEKRSDLARYADRFCGQKSEQSRTQYHFKSGQYSVMVTAEGDDGPRDAETVNAQFRFLITQMFVDAAGGGPPWLRYGLSHHYERDIPCNTINCGVRADESVDRNTQYDWERKMKKRCEHEALCIPFVDLTTMSDLGYYGHVQSWSRVGFLLEDREKFAQFLRTVLGKYSKTQQIAALMAVYELEPEQFDEQWRKWALKNYK